MEEETLGFGIVRAGTKDKRLAAETEVVIMVLGSGPVAETEAQIVVEALQPDTATEAQIVVEGSELDAETEVQIVSEASEPDAATEAQIVVERSGPGVETKVGAEAITGHSPKVAGTAAIGEIRATVHSAGTGVDGGPGGLYPIPHRRRTIVIM